MLDFWRRRECSVELRFEVCGFFVLEFGDWDELVEVVWFLVWWSGECRRWVVFLGCFCFWLGLWVLL